jgi:hypothetical protein
VLNRKIKLESNGQTQVRGKVKRVIVRESTGPVLIETDKNESVVVNQGDNVLFESVSNVMTITDLSDEQNEILFVIIFDGEGDIKTASSVAEISNTNDIVGAAPDFSIHYYYLTGDPVKILDAETSRRSALISTMGGACSISKSSGGQTFTIDGILEHCANGELWAVGNDVEVEILEYLNVKKQAEVVKY